MPSWRSAAIELRQVVAVALDVRFRQTCDRRGGPAVRVDFPAPKPGLDAPGNHSLEKGANAIDDPQFESRLFDSSWRHRQRVQRRRFYVAGRNAVDERGNRPGHRGDFRHAQGCGANGLPGIRGVEHLVGLRAGPRVQLPLQLARVFGSFALLLPERLRSAEADDGRPAGNQVRSPVTQRVQAPFAEAGMGNASLPDGVAHIQGLGVVHPPHRRAVGDVIVEPRVQLEGSPEYQDRQQATRDLRSCRHQNWA